MMDSGKKRPNKTSKAINIASMSKINGKKRHQRLCKHMIEYRPYSPTWIQHFELLGGLVGVTVSAHKVSFKSRVCQMQDIIFKVTYFTINLNLLMDTDFWEPSFSLSKKPNDTIWVSATFFQKTT